tara:strand:- start:33 stop:473 length:441 start_codon:yes stop_codon:yes gene_type:complete
MAYKQPSSGSTFKMMGSSPAKQLKGKYMRSPQEKAFYESSESEGYEPAPMGTYRTPSTVSVHKETGKTKTTGWPSSKPPKKKGTSEKVGPAESTEAIKAKEVASNKAQKEKEEIGFGDREASKKARATASAAYKAEDEAKSYVKKK